MKGINELCLNPGTVMAALQHYFDTVLFRETASPTVVFVNQSPGDTFLVRVENKPVTK